MGLAPNFSSDFQSEFYPKKWPTNGVGGSMRGPKWPR